MFIVVCYNVYIAIENAHLYYPNLFPTRDCIRFLIVVALLLIVASGQLVPGIFSNTCRLTFSFPLRVMEVSVNWMSAFLFT